MVEPFNDTIRNYLNAIHALCPELTDTELYAIGQKVTLKELNKKDYFAEAEKVQEVIGFIAKGLIRTYYIDELGNEKNVGFFPENEYATHYPSFISKQPSKYYIQCLEPCTLVCLTLGDLQELYRQYPPIERYGRLIAEEVLIKQQTRIESFIFQTAEERYLGFITHYPTLFNRISLSHLCSYLGIERQSLTRIRQKLAHQ